MSLSGDHITVELDSVKCVDCKYPLQGLPLVGACPECGLPVDESIRTISRTQSKETLRIISGFSIFAIGLVLGALVAGVLSRGLERIVMVVPFLVAILGYPLVFGAPFTMLWGVIQISSGPLSSFPVGRILRIPYRLFTVVAIFVSTFSSLRWPYLTVALYAVVAFLTCLWLHGFLRTQKHHGSIIALRVALYAALASIGFFIFLAIEPALGYAIAAAGNTFATPIFLSFFIALVVISLVAIRLRLLKREMKDTLHRLRRTPIAELAAAQSRNQELSAETKESQPFGIT